MFYKRCSSKNSGFTLIELMMTVTILAVVFSVGPNIFLNIVQYFRLQMARANVQKNARTTLDLVNRTLRQATSSSVVISNRPNQPPYSSISFSVSKGNRSSSWGLWFLSRGALFTISKRRNNDDFSRQFTIHGLHLS